ncbi:hypothetical protein GCM10025863_09330 [Microbacterium suwonense]|uniref:Uncharacterized protein n=1 Tax=Microbacterium suwonense TaxID=683047 RepID=A0ABM8FRP7_9MICO|nr:hypothetical protein GCM10025863_09330 [Microbacterium suwonense]
MLGQMRMNRPSTSMMTPVMASEVRMAEKTPFAGNDASDISYDLSEYLAVAKIPASVVAPVAARQVIIRC